MNDTQLCAMAEEEARKLIEKKLSSDSLQLCEIGKDIPYELKNAFYYYVEKILKKQGYSIVNRYDTYVTIEKSSN